MGAVLLNSINMITGVSNGLYRMGQVGITIIITVISFMIAWYLVMMTLEVFGKMRKKKEKQWEPKDYD